MEKDAEYFYCSCRREPASKKPGKWLCAGSTYYQRTAGAAALALALIILCYTAFVVFWR